MIAPRHVLRATTLAALLATPGVALTAPDAPTQPEPPAESVRAAADGAGPSHLFWLTGDARSDVIGVVDPLFAAIRFYRVAAADGATPLERRMTSLGACALPIDFRPWRVHHRRGSVVLESMPDPGAAGHAARPATMRTRTLTIARTLVARSADSIAQAGRSIDKTRWDPTAEIACGPESRAARPGAASLARATRLGARAIALSNRRGALASTARLAVHSATNRLYSANELEPTRTYRIVEAAEALPSADGILRVRRRFLAYSGGRLRHAITLRDADLRGKLGQKPVAVLPDGELLVLGKQPGARPFRIASCGMIGGTLDTSVCTEDRGPPPPQQLARTTGTTAPAPAKPLDARTIFANVARLVNYPLRVDASQLPESCRSPHGCAVPGTSIPFVPIRGIRLTRGIFQRTGMPYAQARVPQDIDPLYAASTDQLTRSLARVRDGARGWPGNLADGLEGDLGVDCSGLIQIAWGGRDGRRLDTGSLQRLAHPLACSSRIPGPEYLRAGDAIGLRIDAPVHMMNHVVLFAAAMRLDGANDSWLVLESSSSCDGVCWSVYDPGYFDGWGLYRAGGRSDGACIPGTAEAATPIPWDLSRWDRLTGQPTY